MSIGTAVAFVRTIMTSVEKANATLGTPDSFADEQLYGVDAFVFVK